MPTDVVGEGDIDRAVIRAIDPQLAVREPSKETPQGREAVMVRAMTAAKLPNRRIALMLDRNGFSEEQLGEEVTAVARRVWRSQPLRNGPWYRRETSAVRLVLAGLPDDATLCALGITRFTVDDYVLLLTLNTDALRLFCADETRLAYTPTNADALRELLVSTAEHLRDRGVTVNSSKRYLDLVRAIIGFTASRARYAEHMITRASDAQEAILGDLRRALQTDPPLAAGP